MASRVRAEGLFQNFPGGPVSFYRSVAGSLSPSAWPLSAWCIVAGSLSLSGK